jgi:hypothetical protein
MAVSGDGVVHVTPIAGATLQLSGAGSWTASPGGAVTADGQGIGRWQVRCGAAGSQPLSITINGTDTFPLNLAPCAEPTTTTTGPGPATTVA